jgi:glycine/serine hydroxymethyltransferase
MKEKEMLQVGAWIADALNQRKDPRVLERIRRQVHELADAFPLYSELREPVTAV